MKKSIVLFGDKASGKTTKIREIVLKKSCINSSYSEFKNDVESASDSIDYVTIDEGLSINQIIEVNNFCRSKGIALIATAFLSDDDLSKKALSKCKLYYCDYKSKLQGKPKLKTLFEPRDFNVEISVMCKEKPLFIMCNPDFDDQSEESFTICFTLKFKGLAIPVIGEFKAKFPIKYLDEFISIYNKMDRPQRDTLVLSEYVTYSPVVKNQFSF